MSRPFHFKKFEIIQEHTPMKVGTDAVLLGAWCSQSNPQKILDIGTGTGVIALMMAQRFEEAEIVALDVNPQAIAEARLNVSQSPWHNRVNVLQADLAKFQPKSKFDLIVANPPFFHGDLKSPENGKSTARHAAHFDVKTFAKSAKWLNDQGILAGIYPTGIYEIFKLEMGNHGFTPVRILKVQPTPLKPPHRILFEFSADKSTTEEISSIIIEDGRRHEYSNDYRQLTRHFYLNF